MSSHIAPCYEYVNRRESESEFGYGQRVAQELEEEILRLGPDSVMAFMAEPVVGATMGAVPAVEGYFRRIREVCDHYGVLLILDEVMCGMGPHRPLVRVRSRWCDPRYSLRCEGVGRGLPNPSAQCSAPTGFYSAIKDGSGFFQHGHTYLGHPVASAAALAVLKKLISHRLVDRVVSLGDYLRTALLDQFGQHPHVGDIRGRGLFFGLEFVSDRDGKTPFPPDIRFASKVKSAAFEAGLICYPMSGTRDGRYGDHVLLAPPFIIENEQVDELLDKLFPSHR